MPGLARVSAAVVFSIALTGCSIESASHLLATSALATDSLVLPEVTFHGETDLTQPHQGVVAVPPGARSGTEPTGSKRPTGTPPKTAKAAIYRGKASCRNCPEAVGSMLSKDAKTKWTVVYVGDDATTPIQQGALDGIDLYVQPGGPDDVREAWKDMGAAAQSTVRTYVEGGGNYLGICMGAYMAGKFDTTGFGWVRKVSPYRGADANGQVVPVTWNGVKRMMYFADGAHFGESGSGLQSVATYSSGQLAAGTGSAGKGRIGVVGTHPEADKYWYNPAEEGDTDGVDLDLGLDLVHRIVDR